MTKKTVTLSTEEAEIVADMIKFLRRKFPLQETTDLSQKLNIFLDQQRSKKKNESKFKPDRFAAKRPPSVRK